MTNETVLRVVMFDKTDAVNAVIEGDHAPYRRRLVSIDLTAEQAALLTRRGPEMIGEVWLESIEEPEATDGE